MSLLAVKDMTIEASISEPALVCTITAVGPYSTILLSDGSYAVREDFTATVAGVTTPTGTVADPAVYTATFTATSTKVTSQGLKLLSEGDTSNIITAKPTTPNGVASPISFTLKISDAGKDLVDIK